MLLSFVIPVYNEAKRIRKSISEIVKFQKGLAFDTEWIFVDDGSTDETGTLARTELGPFPHRWLRLEVNRGKGRAVQTGMLEARGDYIFFSDLDLSTPLTEYEKLLKPLREGFDVALASRGPGADVRIHQNWLRETMGKSFNLLGRFLAFKEIRDTQCGFKAFRREAAGKLFALQKLKGFSFDAEIIFLAQRLGYRLKEVPVTWVNSPDSKVRIVQDSLQMLWDLFRIRWIHRNDLQERMGYGKGD